MNKWVEYTLYNVETGGSLYMVTVYRDDDIV